jgi:hypothetical protein
MIHFRLTEDKKRARIDLMYRVNADLFEIFKNTCVSAGGAYSREYNGQVCMVEEVPSVMELFNTLNMKSSIEEELLNLIQNTAETIKSDMKQSEKRLIKMEKVLKKDKKQLREYQRLGVMWLASRRRALLADEMGTGKTIQAIMALPDNAAVVICAPKAAKRAWFNECKKWRPDIVPYLMEGRGNFMWPAKGQMLIYNYDILPGSPPKNCPKHVHFIGDEIHMCKDISRKRTKFFRQIKDVVIARLGRVWVLTGTPMLNRPSELWGVLEAADMAADAYVSWQNFMRVFKGAPDGKKFVWGTPLPEAGLLLKKVCLMRKRADVLPELPVKSFEKIDVDIFDKKVIHMLDEIVADLKDAGYNIKDVSLEELAENGVVFEKISRMRNEMAIAKIPHMLEQVEMYEENEEPLVVFSAHTAPINTLKDREGWAIITGDVSQDKRDNIIKDFQDGKYKGLGITIQAGGVGITLTHAAHALFVDKMWTPALNWQAEDRICRIGQTRGCMIKSLVCSHVLEQHIYYKLDEKTHIIVNGIDTAKTTETDVTEYNLNLGVLKTARVGEAKDAKPNAKTIDRIVQIVAKSEQLKTPDEVRATPLRRKPQSPLENWVAQGLEKLASYDTDRARVVNGIGFNKMDTTIGNSFAEHLAKAGGLTDKQWSSAASILRKYQGQIGKMPVGTEATVA